MQVFIIDIILVICIIFIIVITFILSEKLKKKYFLILNIFASLVAGLVTLRIGIFMFKKIKIRNFFKKNNIKLPSENELKTTNEL